jgi:hypothetical protein
MQPNRIVLILIRLVSYHLEKFDRHFLLLLWWYFSTKYLTFWHPMFHYFWCFFKYYFRIGQTLCIFLKHLGASVSPSLCLSWWQWMLEQNSPNKFELSFVKAILWQLLFCSAARFPLCLMCLMSTTRAYIPPDVTWTLPFCCLSSLI